MVDIDKRDYEKMYKKVKKILLNIISVLFLVIVFGNLFRIPTKDSTYKKDLNDGWEVTKKNVTKKNVNLNEYYLNDLEYNEKIVMKRKIDSKDLENEKNISILLRQTKVKVKVFIDKKMIYESDNENNYNNYFISIKDEILNKTLKIEYTVIEKKDFTKLASPTLVDELKYDSYVIRKSYFDLFMASFYIIFAIIAIILALCTDVKNIFMKRLIVIGMVMISISFWILTNCQAIDIFLDNNNIRELIKSYSVYAGVPLYIATIDTFVENKKRKRINKLLLSFLCALVTVGLIITLFKRELLKDVENKSSIVGVIIIGFVFYSIIKEFKEKRKSEKYLIISMVELGATLIFEVLFYTQKRLLGEEYTASSYVKIGLAIYVLLMLLAYAQYVIEVINNAVEKKDLTKQAYQDILTGLYNRIKVMETIEELKISKIQEYTIVNFDLNNLKKVNDSKGHTSGDFYLKTFSSIIKELLKDTFSVIGRVGGDEFIAISDNFIKKESLEKILKKALKELSKECKKSIGIEARFAYGYVASNKNEPIKIDEACKMADKMMYECKKKQKEMQKDKKA